MGERSVVITSSVSLSGRRESAPSLTRIAKPSIVGTQNTEPQTEQTSEQEVGSVAHAVQSPIPAPKCEIRITGWSCKETLGDVSDAFHPASDRTWPHGSRT